MRRREFTGLVTLAGAGVLAGCLGDDGDTSEENGDEEDPAPTATETPVPEADSTPTPDADSASTPLEQTPTPTESPEEETDTGGGSDGERQDPTAVLKGFFESFQTGDATAINSFLHPDATIDPLDTQEADQLADAAFTVESVTVRDRTEQRAVVAVTVSADSTLPLRQIEAVELRLAAGAWKVYAFERADQDRPPAANFEFESGEGTVTITHAAGDSVPAEQLVVRGDGLDATGTWNSLDGETDEDGAVVAGLTVTVPVAESPVSVELVWESTDSDESAVLATATLDVALPSEVPDAVADWLSDANAYDGLVDWTDRDEGTVVVGGGGNDRAFEPPGVRITTDTTIVWEWSGRGGSHNVIAEDDTFESDLVAESGHTFEYTFDEPGTYLYYCFPHRPSGMKGAVVVE